MFQCYLHVPVPGGDFLRREQGGAHTPLKFSSTPKKISKKEYALCISIIIDLIERKFQLKGEV